MKKHEKIIGFLPEIGQRKEIESVMKPQETISDFMVIASYKEIKSRKKNKSIKKHV